MDEAGTVREQVKSSLPQWRSHKIVRAAPIRAIYKSGVTNEMEDTSIEARPWIVYLDGYPSFQVDAKVFARYFPQPGDYFVVYDDGYESVSPKKAFEEGYTCLEGKPAVGA